MKPATKKRNLTLEQLKRYNTRKTDMDSRCHEQFIRNAKTWLRKHPEAKGKIHLDPDYTFQGELDTKHCGSIGGDIVAVSFDAEGLLVFDHSSQYELSKNVHTTLDVTYGIYVEDWTWALQILLEYLDDPYVPEVLDCEDEKKTDGNAA